MATAWVWLERIHPKKARVPNPAVLAIQVDELAEAAGYLPCQTGGRFSAKARSPSCRSCERITGAAYSI